MTKIEVGGLAMGQVARRHMSPSRTRTGWNSSFANHDVLAA